MKIPLVVALVGLALSFALPTFAQQTNTPDPQLREQLLALAKKFEEAWDNNDAAALAALFTEDAVLVNDSGPVNGREAIKKYYTDLFQNVHFSNNVTTYNDPNCPHAIGTDGNEMWENGEWSMTWQVKGGDPVQGKGYHASIAVREGGVWKKRLLVNNVTPAPATAGSAMAQDAMKVIRPDELVWKEHPVFKGAQIVYLMGDPTKAETIVQRTKIPPHFRIPPHTHPYSELVTVLSGTYWNGMGDDMEKGVMLKPGSAFVLPANHIHHTWTTDEETIVQVTFTGPGGVTFVNPADDPRKK